MSSNSFSALPYTVTPCYLGLLYVILTLSHPQYSEGPIPTALHAPRLGLSSLLALVTTLLLHLQELFSPVLEKGLSQPHTLIPD